MSDRLHSPDHGSPLGPSGLLNPDPELSESYVPDYLSGLREREARRKSSSPLPEPTFWERWDALIATALVSLLVWIVLGATILRSCPKPAPAPEKASVASADAPVEESR